MVWRGEGGGVSTIYWSYSSDGNADGDNDNIDGVHSELMEYESEDEAEIYSQISSPQAGFNS